MALKQRHVSSTRTGPLICVISMVSCQCNSFIFFFCFFWFQFLNHRLSNMECLSSSPGKLPD